LVVRSTADEHINKNGTTLGALIVGLGLLITGFAKFNNPTVIIVGLISGALWAFG
jgi:glucose uptake protein